MTARGPALGFDVGGQSVKAALVSADGAVLAHSSEKTGEKTDAPRLADILASLGRSLLDRGGASAASGIGVGIAGVLGRDGLLKGSPHLPLLIGKPLAAVLSATFGSPVAVHNDADCAAVAEGWGGSASGRDDFLLITLGTGVGSGLILGGRLRAGASGFGCEFGHATVVYGGRRCGCGNLGCLEAYISETAATRLVEEASVGLRSRVAERRSRDGGGFAEALFVLGAAGDAEAEDVAGAMVDVLGAAIGSVVNVLDLTTIVLGGGIAPGALARLARLRRAAAGTLFARSEADLEILAAARGPLAGAIGAARLGMLPH